MLRKVIHRAQVEVHNMRKTVEKEMKVKVKQNLESHGLWWKKLDCEQYQGKRRKEIKMLWNQYKTKHRLQQHEANSKNCCDVSYCNSVSFTPKVKSMLCLKNEVKLLARQCDNRTILTDLFDSNSDFWKMFLKE